MDERKHTPALKPCPWCNDTTPSATLTRHSTGEYSVGCDCGATGPVANTMDAATTAWNTRAEGVNNT